MSAPDAFTLSHTLVDRYAAGPRLGLRGVAPVPPPVEYPEVGVYHPRMAQRLSASVADLPRVATSGQRGAIHFCG